MKIYHIAFRKGNIVRGFIVTEEEVERKISYYTSLRYKLIEKQEV